jgi:nucleoid-associated protein YgaU
VAEAELLRQAQQQALAAEAAHPAAKKNKIPIPALPTAYTVRRGETLPQISARSEIYNDSTLWPIIFRANRDQIRDPKRLWPGQVITIPRNFSRIDAR